MITEVCPCYGTQTVDQLILQDPYSFTLIFHDIYQMTTVYFPMLMINSNQWVNLNIDFISFTFTCYSFIENVNDYSKDLKKMIKHKIQSFFFIILKILPVLHFHFQSGFHINSKLYCVNKLYLAWLNVLILLLLIWFSGFPELNRKKEKRFEKRLMMWIN